MTSWTQAEDDIIEIRTKAGDSAATIAEDHLVGRSRNAVLGRKHRLGWATPRKHGKRKVSQNRTLKRPLYTKPKPKRDIPKLIPRDEYLFNNLVYDVNSKKISLMELETGQCRWPVSPISGSHYFCGRDAQEGKPYCNHHQDRSVSPHQFQKIVNTGF